MVLCKITGCDGKLHGHGFCSKHYYRFIRHGDPNKTLRPHPIIFPDGWRDILFSKYNVDGLCATQIANEYGCHKTTILEQLEKFGIPRRKFKRDNLVKKCVMYMGGYLYEYLPSHPMANRTGYVAQHVRIMSDYLNRKLRRGEVVHHVDGDCKNNALDNLRLMARGKHTSLHERTKSLQTLRGISWNGNGWKITIGNKYVGFSTSYDNAIGMKKAAELEFWGHD